MNRRILLALPGLLLLRPGPARAADAQATIDNFAFSPPVLTVAAGTVVTWTNRDDIPHTVTDKDHPREIRSAALDTGDSYSRTFTAPGSYAYFCSLHRICRASWWCDDGAAPSRRRPWAGVCRVRGARNGRVAGIDRDALRRGAG